MGSDIIGWRNCSLQRDLGPQGFLGKLKLKSYKAVIDRSVPPEQRATQKVAVMVNGPAGPTRRDLTYPGICADLESFERGTPECASCPLSSGKPLGCYQYVAYPIDQAFERLVFEFFVANVAIKDSICDQLYTDVVSRVPGSGTGWHDRRGTAEQGALAALPAPLRHEWGMLFFRKRFDSAQILQALFGLPLPHPALVVGYARFWIELVAFAKERNVAVADSPTLEVVQSMLPFWAAVAAGATEGWSVVVDG